MSDSLDAEALLFGSQQASTFFAEHWGRSWVRRQAPTNLSDLFTLDELAAHAFTSLSPGRGGDVMHFRAAFVDEAGRGRTFGGPLEMARQLLDLGMTLTFDDLQRTHPKLTALAAAVARLVGTVGDVTINCFLSPDGSGFPWHIDTSHVLVLQVSGEKRWLIGPRVAAPPLPLQRDSPDSAATAALLSQLKFEYPRPLDESATEVLMRPNDILYLPPGQWHRANAQGSSTHLSLVIRPFGFARLLRALLTVGALGRSDWRDDIQRIGATDRAATTSPELLAFLTTRLSEARAVLSGLTPERLAATLETLRAAPSLRDLVLDRTASML